MTHLIGQALLGFLKGLAGLLPRPVTEGFNSAVDFAYVRVLGLPFIVLGYRQTGKTTLIEWLREDMSLQDAFEPEPTTSGGEAVPTFSTRVGHERMRLRPRRDVGGEYAMWETDWVDLLRDARPRGIIFMIDPTNPVSHKDALNFTLQMLDEEILASKNLKAFLLLANKSDLWTEGMTLDSVLEDYRNETRRLKYQSERLGYRVFVHSSSLKTGEGVREALSAFFNAIRPRAARAA